MAVLGRTSEVRMGNGIAVYNVDMGKEVDTWKVPPEECKEK